jgi:nitrous oxide reductase accessory protein NosL
MSPTSRLLRFAALAAAAALLAGCETTQTRPAATAAPAPMTHQRAASECWMATEKTAQSMSLDRRADLVQSCIEKKMRGEPAA